MNKLFIGMKNSKKNIMVQMMDDVGKTSLANRDLKLKKNRQQNKVKKTSDYPCCTLQHISEQTAENVLSRRIFEFQL
jgi:hypothetical protein